MARIPPIDAPPEEALSAGAPAPAPPGWPRGEDAPDNGREAGAARSGTGLKLAAAMNLVVGGLSLAWAGLMALNIMVATAGMLPPDPDMPPQKVIIAVSAVLSAAAMGTAVLQITAGMLLLGPSRGSRGWGIAAGVISCISLWQCCIYPLCLITGVYSLIVLFTREVPQVAGSFPR